MAIHKVALIRYKTIDQCLRNRTRKWTLEMLISKVSEALYEYEGIEGGVSKRTIQADIQLMRSDRLGYNAPIMVVNKRYYCYADDNYSIHHTKVTNADIEKMSEIVSVLRQMNGFDYFDDMNDIIARLENSLYKTVHHAHNHIQLEGNKQLKGLEHILPLYQAIRKQVPLLITYQSFKAKAPSPAVYHPYLLKEYRNRWFLICRPRKAGALVNLALDRILEFMEMSPRDFLHYTGVDFERYYSETIGVTRSERDRAQKVVLWICADHAPYVLTKPLHSSQQLLSKEPDGSIVIRIDVTLNFELEREILGFGDMMKVLSPRNLQSIIRKRLQSAAERYLPVTKDN